MRGPWKFAIYLGVGLFLVALSILLLLWSVGFMESGFVATSLLTALSGFTLLSGGLYVLRLSAYVYAVERGAR